MRDVTQDTDKLIAISAVAKKMQPLCQSTHLAGLWKQYLPNQLLWVVDHTGFQKRGLTKPQEYCAHTRSWAGVKVPYKLWELFDIQRKDFMIEVLKADARNRGDDETGIVLSRNMEPRC